jgi:hypothetical protein
MSALTPAEIAAVAFFNGVIIAVAPPLWARFKVIREKWIQTRRRKHASADAPDVIRITRDQLTRIDPPCGD